MERDHGWCCLCHIICVDGTCGKCSTEKKRPGEKRGCCSNRKKRKGFKGAGGRGSKPGSKDGWAPEQGEDWEAKDTSKGTGDNTKGKNTKGNSNTGKGNTVSNRSGFMAKVGNILSSHKVAPAGGGRYGNEKRLSMAVFGEAAIKGPRGKLGTDLFAFVAPSEAEMKANVARKHGSCSVR